MILTSEATSVRLVSGRLEVTQRDFGNPKAEPVHTAVRLFDLERVICIGRPNLTFPVICELADRGIRCVMISRNGAFRGQLVGRTGVGSAERRIRQYALAGDEAFNLAAAKALIAAKIHNSRTVLMRLSSNRQKDGDATAGACAELADLGRRAAACDDMANLRGCEGIAAAHYFKALSSFFPAAFPFAERSRRPPADPANALLSFAYGIVLSELSSLILAHGLDIGIGVMHGLRINRPALALDLMEPLRAPIADMLVVGGLNHGLYVREDFEVSEEDGGTYLSDSGRRKFFPAYEEAMRKKYDNNGTCRETMGTIVRNYMRALSGAAQMAVPHFRQ